MIKLYDFCIRSVHKKEMGKRAGTHRPHRQAQKKVHRTREQARVVLLDIEGTLFIMQCKECTCRRLTDIGRRVILKQLEIVSLAVPVMSFNSHFDFVSN